MNFLTNEVEKSLLERLKNAVIFFDDQEMELSAKEWNDMGLDPSIGIFYGLVPGMEEVGKLYEDQVYFIPEMLLCADVLYKGLEILKTNIYKTDILKRGKILIGVVDGDIHDIGKNIVKMMLEISGFEVYDLGRDVPLQVFKEQVREIRPDIVCLSTMMSTTLQQMRKVIKALKQDEPELKVLVGGAPITEKIARSWGVSGYGKDANHALRAAISIMEQMKKQLEPELRKVRKSSMP